MAKKAARAGARSQTLREAAAGSADRPDALVREVLAGDVRFEAKVTGYATTIVRIGSHDDFLGWIALIGEDGSAVGYVYLRGPLQPPRISFKHEYVVLDWLPEQMGALLDLLHSGEPLRVRYSGDEDEGWAFLERR